MQHPSPCRYKAAKLYPRETDTSARRLTVLLDITPTSALSEEFLV